MAVLFFRLPYCSGENGELNSHTSNCKSRARLADRFCKNTSGKEKQDFIRQKSAELKRAPKHQKTHILQAAGCAPVRVSKKQLLALHIKLSLSRGKHKLMRQFLRSSGIPIPSAPEEKQEQEAALSSDIQVESKRLLYPNENSDEKTLKETEIPVASITHIPYFVSNLLEKNAETARLTWHDGMIPEGEIWVKIGADHGGGSFKVTMQIANVANPNSKHNTSILIMSPCKDTHENIKRILEPYQQQLAELNGMQWHDKKVRVFVFGDYDFLLKAYGLSGATGKHPCLYCKATKHQFQYPPAINAENIANRTLHNIKEDHRRLRRSKKTNKQAKHFYNAAKKPLLNVDVDHVAPPYLHILLGVTKKHHDLLVAD